MGVPEGLQYRPLILGESDGQAHMVVAVSEPGDSGVCKLVDYVGDGSVGWVQDVDVPCAQVSADERGRIHTVALDADAGKVMGVRSA